MAYIVLFPPGSKPQKFANASEFKVKDGILEFYHPKDSRQQRINKIVTNIPFMITEEVG